MGKVRIPILPDQHTVRILTSMPYQTHIHVRMCTSFVIVKDFIDQQVFVKINPKTTLVSRELYMHGVVIIVSLGRTEDNLIKGLISDLASSISVTIHPLLC